MTGSIGLIIAAAFERRVNEAIAVAALRALPGVGRMFVAPTLIDAAIVAVEGRSRSG